MFAHNENTGNTLSRKYSLDMVLIDDVGKDCIQERCGKYFVSEIPRTWF